MSGRTGRLLAGVGMVVALVVALATVGCGSAPSHHVSVVSRPSCGSSPVPGRVQVPVVPVPSRAGSVRAVPAGGGSSVRPVSPAVRVPHGGSGDRSGSKPAGGSAGSGGKSLGKSGSGRSLVKSPVRSK